MSQTAAPKLTHLAPVLVVDRIEPCVEFWVKRLGFSAANEVPGSDGALQFASVVKDGIEIMYQSTASAAADNAGAAGDFNPRSGVLFLTVENLDAVERAVEGAPVVKPRHTTFYGSTELYVRDPAGTMVGFAQF